MSIQDELSARMQRANLNPNSLAAKTKIPQATIWRILNGESKEPKESTVTKLASFFGVTNDAIWGRSAAPREPGDEFVPVQRVHIRASAGITGFAVEHIEGNGPPIFFRADWIAAKRLNPAQLYALKIVGSSMEPGLWDGDLVVLDSTDTSPKDGEVFVVNYEGEVLIKRLRRDVGAWWLDSDNARHKPKLCDEHAILIGRVIYKQSERI